MLMLPLHDGYVAELGKLQALGKAIMLVFMGKGAINEPTGITHRRATWA